MASSPKERNRNLVKVTALVKGPSILKGVEQITCTGKDAKTNGTIMTFKVSSEQLRRLQEDSNVLLVETPSRTYPAVNEIAEP